MIASTPVQVLCIFILTFWDAIENVRLAGIGFGALYDDAAIMVSLILKLRCLGAPHKPTVLAFRLKHFSNHLLLLVLDFLEVSHLQVISRWIRKDQRWTGSIITRNTLHQASLVRQYDAPHMLLLLTERSLGQTLQILLLDRSLRQTSVPLHGRGVAGLHFDHWKPTGFLDRLVLKWNLRVGRPGVRLLRCRRIHFVVDFGEV